MTAIDFFCRHCGTKNTFNRRYVKETDCCVVCLKAGQWSTEEAVRDDAPDGWTLNANDRRFLKSVRIAPE